MAETTRSQLKGQLLIDRIIIYFEWCVFSQLVGIRNALSCFVCKCSLNYVITFILPIKS